MLFWVAYLKKKSRYLKMSRMKVSKFPDELTLSGKQNNSVFNRKRKDKFDIKMKYYFLLCPNLLKKFFLINLGVTVKRAYINPQWEVKTDEPTTPLSHIRVAIYIEQWVVL